MKNPVTVYQSGSFGITKYEGDLIAIGTKQYAQYKDAAFVHFIPKGKRKPMGLLATYAPYLVVIEGHGHISPADPFGPKKESNGLLVSQTRYSSFDERYKTDFDIELSEYIKDKTVLMDRRETVGTNLIPQNV